MGWTSGLETCPVPVPPGGPPNLILAEGISMMGRTERRLLLRFLCAGIISGLASWAGGLVLPQGSLVLKVYPGLVLGLSLFVVGRLNGLGEAVARPLSLLILLGSAVVGWRAAVDVGYMRAQPLGMLAAGGLGAGVLGLGLIWAWGVQARRLAYLAIVTLTGAAAAQLFELVWGAFGRIGDQLWLLALFVEWQSIVMLNIGLLAIRSGQVVGPPVRAGRNQR